MTYTQPSASAASYGGHCRDQLQAPLTLARCADALAQPDAEGCRMTDDQACAFAFPRLESQA
jgi:hypothetical protein